MLYGMKQRRVLLVLAVWASLLFTSAVQPQKGHTAEPPIRGDPAPLEGHARQASHRTWEATTLPTKVEPMLLKQVLEGDLDDQYRFIVELAPQANLESLPYNLTRSERHLALVALLQSTARQTQADLLAFLQEQQTEGRVQEIHPFWVFNGVAVTADASTLLVVAARPEVRVIRQDHWRRWVDPSSTSENHPVADKSNVEWNIARVRADLAWSALGLDGSGVTVAIMDTGVDWQHPALQAQYRGYKPGGLTSHHGNWFCTTDKAYVYPVDGHGHGTHVAGLAVGTEDATGRAIGMAPGARWIAVKMLDNAGYGYDSWIHAAFEWLMAPAGDPALAPDAVNGSWGAPDGEAETFRADVQALRAAGIVPVFAAGNHGPGKSSLGKPASYPEAIAVGATDDLDVVVGYSSRGPSPWEEIKPEVAAPGTQVRSSRPGGTYGSKAGTSMAAPHVTGLAALLLQADPTLTVDEIEALITSTATSLGEKVPNNDTGWGRIDAYQAAAVALKAGFVGGQVTRYPDQQALTTAQITAYDHLGNQRAVVTPDDAGRYRVALPPGRYSLHVAAFGYKPQTVSGVSVQTAITTTVDLILAPEPAGVLWGKVSNAGTGGPVRADLSVVGTPAHTTSDSQAGQYSLVLPAGIYGLQATQNGYRRHTRSGIKIVADRATRVDVSLTPAPTLLLVDSGRWYYDSQASYFEQAMADRAYVYDVQEIRDLATDVPQLEDLSPYDIIVWSSPLDSPGMIGAGDVISDYLSMGGNLFLTGQDVGFWDDGLSGRSWHEYYGRFLKAKALDDDAGRANVVGLPGEILHDLSLPMNGPDSAGNQFFPDLIALLEPREATIIGRYADSGDASLQVRGCQSYRAVYLAAGLEGLGNQADRAEVMDRSLTLLDTPHPAVEVELYPLRQDQVWQAGRSITYTAELRNTGRATDRFALSLSPSVWPSSVWDAAFSQTITQSTSLGACQTQTLGLKVTVPPDVAWNVSDVVTLTARSQAESARTTQAAFHSKAPAPILLVDGHRWYDTLGDYQTALEANQFPYDVWSPVPDPHPGAASPSLQRLQRYPVVIWFTAYDWYATLTPDDEAQLTAYLDGGGRLLFSSQDYLYTNGFTDFASRYLGVAGYTESLTATRVMGAAGSPVGDHFAPSDLAYPFPNWSDALRPTPTAQLAFWGQHAQPVALTSEHSPWKTAFFAFPLEAFAAKEMADAVGQVVDWLSPLGDSTLTVDRAVVSGGEILSYTLLIRNTGAKLLDNVTLSNPVPAHTTFVPGSLEGPARHDAVGNRFTWNGALAPGQTIRVGYQLRVDDLLPDGTAVRNVAQLSDESGIALDRIAISRLRTPDLSASSKVSSAAIAQSTQALTYTLALQNDGLRSAQAQLIDFIPLHTVYLPGSAWASSGLLTSTAEALLWTGPIPVGEAVTITFPVVISPTAAGSYVLNRASLDDGWGEVRSLEAYAWVEVQVFLPLVLKQH
jgi:uncharacterized repeat protein (TIGR01451 family)